MASPCLARRLCPWPPKNRRSDALNLEVSLDRAWVEEEEVEPGTIKRSFFRQRDERLERVYKHQQESRPRAFLTLW